MPLYLFLCPSPALKLSLNLFLCPSPALKLSLNLFLSVDLFLCLNPFLSPGLLREGGVVHNGVAEHAEVGQLDQIVTTPFCE
jgi:hypothetical protein